MKLKNYKTGNNLGQVFWTWVIQTSDKAIFGRHRTKGKLVIQKTVENVK